MNGRIRARDCALSLRDLPSPPAVYARLTALLEEPGWTVGRVAEVLKGDPSVVARTLRLANSPAYGLVRQVDTLDQAVSLLGLAELRQLVLATTVMDRFTRVPPELLSPESFRRRSVRAAVIAAGLAERGAGADPRRVFLPALLHDIGSLVVCLVLPERAYEAVQLRTPEGPQPLPFSLERAAFGGALNEVGAALLDHWRMPRRLCSAVRCCPQPGEAGDAAPVAAVVNLAHRLAAAAEDEPVEPVPADDGAWALAGLDPEAATGVTAETETDFRELLALFSGHGQ